MPFTCRCTVRAPVRAPGARAQVRRLRERGHLGRIRVGREQRRVVVGHVVVDAEGGQVAVGVLRRAIEAAEEAQKEWRKLTGKERAAILRKWHDLMMANQEDLAVLMTTEQGKPIAESRGEIAYAAAFIEWFAEEGKRVYGDTIPGHGGFTDRMDCQIIMGLFVYVYITHVVGIPGSAMSKLFSKVTSLPAEQQVRGSVRLWGVRCCALCLTKTRWHCRWICYSSLPPT